MRTLCDVCENAAAILFCAADEAALCRACDDKVHTCNKLASRHVRVGLAEPSALQRCDICENAPAFFYCAVDGSSLCLQCDMIVHVDGKKTHGRYLLLRQKIEFPGDKDEPGSQRSNLSRTKENNHNHRGSPILIQSDDTNGNMENHMIDLNSRPQRMNGQAENNQGQSNGLAHNSHKSESVVPDGYFKSESEKSESEKSEIEK